MKLCHLKVKFDCKAHASFSSILGSMLVSMLLLALRETSTVSSILPPSSKHFLLSKGIVVIIVAVSIPKLCLCKPIFGCPALALRVCETLVKQQTLNLKLAKQACFKGLKRLELEDATAFVDFKTYWHL